MTNDELYKQTIQTQREYLMKLQDAFNKRCDEIATHTNEKLKNTPETNIEERKKIFDEQKTLLEEALSQLRTEVNRSGAAVRKKLESINAESENIILTNIENSFTTLKK